MQPGLGATRLAAVFSILAFSLAPALAHSESEPEESRTPRMGGPQSIENELESDRAARDLDLYQLPYLDPYFDWKDQLADESGFAFGMDYTSAGRFATDSISGTDENAGGGVVRFFGTWDIVGRGTDTTGSLAYRIAHHHEYTDTAPQDMGLGNLGYVGLTDTQFDDLGWKLGNLYWRQNWSAGAFQVVGGFHDVADLFEVYGLTDPFKHFQNLSFLTGAGTISLPSSGSLGVAAGTWLNDNFYIHAGVQDARGDAEEPWDGFETFFSDNDYFTHLELGWTTSRDLAYLDNVHFSFWHVADKDDVGAADGWGFTFNASLWLQERFLPFVKVGYADDGTSLSETSVSTGLGYQPRPVGSDKGDLLAIGLNWAEPNSAVFGSGLRDQYTIEVFYRWQLTREFALTPNIQFVENPSLNLEDDELWLFGLRGRLAL